MKRQSISFTEPNDEWLKSQIDNKEYSSKSELVNDLIRQARNQQQQIDLIRIKLDRAEKSGFMTDSKSEIVFSHLPMDDPKQRRPDLTLAQSLLHWNANIQIHEGLRKTIEEFKTRL